VIINVEIEVGLLQQELWCLNNLISVKKRRRIWVEFGIELTSYPLWRVFQLGKILIGCNKLSVLLAKWATYVRGHPESVPYLISCLNILSHELFILQYKQLVPPNPRPKLNELGRWRLLLLSCMVFLFHYIWTEFHPNTQVRKLHRHLTKHVKKYFFLYKLSVWITLTYNCGFMAK
jgi:hypothetical protein